MNQAHASRLHFAGNFGEIMPNLISRENQTKRIAVE